MEIKNKKSFNDLIKSLTLEVIEEDELDEITVTNDVEGYNTPFFLTGKNKAGKAKKRKISTNSTGYKMLEGIDSKDLKTIKKLIRSVIADVYRDIWIKRGAWK